jgi:inorganic pyrophosphatase
MPWRALFLVAIPCALTAQALPQPSPTLPEEANAALAASLEAASDHARHVWRDTPPVNDDGSVNAYLEIARGDRRKWEFDIRTNRRIIDRVIPSGVGGYPVNYGFVPQTVSYDGDPFDALVLGPPLPGGVVARALVVGLMLMEDEKGVDSKVVLSLAGDRGRPRHELTAAEQARIGHYFSIYKKHEPGKFSRVPGWGSVDDARAYIRMTHAFFRQCGRKREGPCRPAA